MSASALYNPVGDWGRERIRLWGRNETVRQQFPRPLFLVSGVTWANVRFLVDCGQEPRCGELGVNGTDPGDSNGASPFWQAVLYDILGYKGIPTTVIQALVNGLSARTTVEQPRWYDSTVMISAGRWSVFPEERSSLPPAIPYVDADGARQGEYSGISVNFQYHLPRSNANFRVWPQGILAYLVWTRTCDGTGLCDWVPFEVQSGAAGVRHTVNTR